MFQQYRVAVCDVYVTCALQQRNSWYNSKTKKFEYDEWKTVDIYWSTETAFNAVLAKVHPSDREDDYPRIEPVQANEVTIADFIPAKFLARISFGAVLQKPHTVVTDKLEVPTIVGSCLVLVHLGILFHWIQCIINML